MSRKIVISIIVALLLVALLIALVLLLRARNGTSTPTRTVAPTRHTARRSTTRTPRQTAAAQPTSTPRPRAIATAAASFTVDRDAVNVRAGPGTNFFILGSVQRGQTFQPSGRNPAGDWLKFDFNGKPGWVYAPLMLVTRPDLIAVASNISAPPPTPVPPPTAPPNPPTAAPPANPGENIDLVIAPENRCSHYDADDYSYPQSVEPHIVARQGGRIYGPYTGTYFNSIRETDIEHIVARSEAHDSGLCARDLDNLTLASPSVNRHQKVDKDLAQWLPAHNRCWYVNQVILVKHKYGLTWDTDERDAARTVLASCTSTAILFTAGPAAVPTPVPPQPGGTNALDLYDDNNGRITCAEAEAHGIAPVPRGHPAYQYMRDGDGVVSERGEGIGCAGGEQAALSGRYYVGTVRASSDSNQE